MGKLSALNVLMLVGFSVGTLMLGYSLWKALAISVGVVSSSVVVYFLVLDRFKRHLKEMSRPLECDSLDYRLRIICKAIGVKVYVTDYSYSSLFGIAVLPPTPFDRKPVIFITKLAYKLLPRDAIEGAVGHELGHVIRKHYIAMGVIVFSTIVLQIIITHLVEMRFGLNAGLLASVVGAVALTFLTAWVHRQMEFEADRISMRIVGEEKILASLKSTKLLVGRVKNGIFDTHPPIEERIRRVRLESISARR